MFECMVLQAIILLPRFRFPTCWQSLIPIAWYPAPICLRRNLYVWDIERPWIKTVCCPIIIHLHNPHPTTNC